MVGRVVVVAVFLTMPLLAQSIPSQDLYEHSEQPLEELTKWVQDHAQDATAWFYLSIAHKDRRDLDAAFYCLQRAITLDPKNVVMQSTLARHYQRRDQIEKARTTWRQALQIEPGHQKILGYLHQSEQTSRELVTAQIRVWGGLVVMIFALAASVFWAFRLRTGR